MTTPLNDTQAAAAFRHLVELSSAGFPIDANTVRLTADKAAGGIVLLSASGAANPQNRKRSVALAHFGIAPMA